MTRTPNTRADGSPFITTTVQIVWTKATVIPDYDPRVWRWDRCGRVIKFSEYGDTSAYGWEIDHIHPVARGGTDSLDNLQPLQWQNNRRKGDSTTWTCEQSA